MSTLKSHPFSYNSSNVLGAPLKAYFFILFLIWAGVSVRKIDELGSLEDILVPKPYKAGKNLEWITDGLGYFNFYITSRVILKYGS